MPESLSYREKLFGRLFSCIAYRNFYKDNLSEWALDSKTDLPFVPLDCEQAYHLFYIILPSIEARTGLISHLKSRSILSVFHYLPLHLSPMGEKFGYIKGDFPVTESVSDRLLRLPFYNTLKEEELEEVCKAIIEFKVN